MAALHAPPPRTPSPKIRIHRSQSFDSPSSRISVTPIDDSPYSKSASAISRPFPLPSCNLSVLHTKISDDSLMSDASSISSSVESSPVSDVGSGRDEDEERFALFNAGSPTSPSPSPQDLPSHSHTPHPSTSTSSTSSTSAPQHPCILHSSIQLLQFQDSSTPSYDPWLVRIVLDMFDVRGFDWMGIAEPIGRIWGRACSSAEVLEILVGNGRVRRVWWE